MAEFVTKKENMRRLAIVIVCVLANAVGLAVAIYAARETAYVEEKPENPNNIKKVREEIAGQRQINKDLLENYLSYAKDIGWRVEPQASTDRFVQSPLQAESMKAYLSDWVPVLQTLGVTKYKRYDEQGGGENLNILRLFEELLAKEKEYILKIDELKGQIEKERANEREVQKSVDAANAAVLRELVGDVQPSQPAQGLVAEVVRLAQELNKLQKSHAEELATLEKEADEAQHKSTETKNDLSRKRAAYDGTKQEYRRRIYAIQHHREEERERREPDGEILAIDEVRQVAFINLLRKDRLFKGTRFNCYSLEKGGQKLDKGTLEVIEVREDLSSIAAIVSTVDPAWPLKAGDKIYNDLYEGNRLRRIAIAGRFTGKLSNEEAANLIRRFGDEFQEQVQENTNYVIVADGYEEHPNYKAALEYGVKILREKILYDYLGVRQ
jgi:hypothetical protein